MSIVNSFVLSSSMIRTRSNSHNKCPGMDAKPPIFIDPETLMRANRKRHQEPGHRGRGRPRKEHRVQREGVGPISVSGKIWACSSANPRAKSTRLGDAKSRLTTRALKPPSGSGTDRIPLYLASDEIHGSSRETPSPPPPAVLKSHLIFDKKNGGRAGENSSRPKEVLQTDLNSNSFGTRERLRSKASSARVSSISESEIIDVVGVETEIKNEVEDEIEILEEIILPDEQQSPLRSIFPLKVHLKLDAPDAKDEIRRLQVKLRISRFIYKRLCEKLVSVFPKLGEKHFSLEWLDPANDLIAVSNSEQLQEALRIMQSQSAVEFFIKVHDSSNTNGVDRHSEESCS